MTRERGELATVRDRAAARPPWLRADWLWAVGLVLIFAPGLLALAQAWRATSYSSYGYFIPLLALWAAQENRRHLRGLSKLPDVRGYAVLGMALFGYGMGFVANIASLQGLALVAALAGWLLTFFGVGWLRALAFPIGFLVFMVPLPEAWLQPGIGALRLGVSKFGVEFLQAFGVAILREGNVITLPGGGQLGVEDACSGITSLVTLTPLAVFLAYFALRSWGGRIGLVASVLPVALAGNFLRVIAMVLGARQFGVSRMTQPLVHEALGVLTYVISCLALLGVVALLRRMLALERSSGGAKRGT